MVLTTVPGLAVEPLDVADCLNPANWTIAGADAPLVQKVERATSEGVGESRFVLRLDAPMPPKGPLTVGLAVSASAVGPQLTNTTPVPVVGPEVRGTVEAAERGADLAMPVAARAGDLAVADRDAALRYRVGLRVTAALGSFSHLPSFGRGAEPKRNYSTGQLAQAARAMEEDLLGMGGAARDPDIRKASVQFSTAGEIPVFEVAVEPSYRAGVLVVSVPLILGSQP